VYVELPSVRLSKSNGFGSLFQETDCTSTDMRLGSRAQGRNPPSFV